MAHESSLKDTSSIQGTGESSDSSFEIKIKTLDFQTHSFRVNKNMPILALREEVVTKIGVPLEKQRLLYKGKVLKDHQLLSELNLTDGDTMHLAERRLVPVSSTVAAETSRSSSQQGAGAESSQNSRRTRSTNSVNLGLIFQSQPASSLSFFESPWRISNEQELFPDTLTTVNDFIDRMNGEFQSCCNSLNNDQHQLLSLNNDQHEILSRGTITATLPALQTLSIVLWRAAQLLRENATTALSNLSTHLLRIENSDDQVLRGQTQFGAVQFGLAMQHLGALFLELGRASMSLRLGRRPRESSVETGGSVYISSTGPNQIMVEQFPHQSLHPFRVHRPRPVHYRQEEFVPVVSASQISGSALRTGPPSGSNTVPTLEGQATECRTQSDTGNDGMRLSDLDVSRQVEQQVDLGQTVERIARETRNVFGELLEDTVNQHGELNVYEDIVELSNEEFADEVMECLRRYINRRDALESVNY
ncbi:ubiquitin-like domain-containing protein CIP73 isoform X1 [Dendrobium catenatum]|uniref:ubiquitin-like domain-containing protein CIP73 isoform X1 n=2 Tax=Dendrobium catenatum TaxID=906689 RepID=UPI0009F31502|nr:ubiquitin-like domain-containing protein CIP73 isoform X1 [Dendrobium catenatum]